VILVNDDNRLIYSIASQTSGKPLPQDCELSAAGNA
jgi:hypothetical protein